ncbi:MAG: CPBP family intramembrane metalloprotease [Candidatus Protochlamydia sp.]|nr:CPBP family intramembrane metalloprotease [Candidatus Protochlamydia sp.]
MEEIHQHLYLLLLGMLWGLPVLYSAWKKGFFETLPISFLPKIRGKDVLKGFIVFVLAEVVIIPALAVVTVYAATGKLLVYNALDIQEKGWLNAFIILGGFIALLRVYFDLPPETRRSLWKQTSLPGKDQVLFGIRSWFVIYPLILVFSQSVGLAVLMIFEKPALDQVAVKHIKNVMAYPTLMGMTMLEVIIIVPLMEEFLFRGLLQNWLKRKLNHAAGAVLLTSLLFALFHFSSSQGVTNIELLSTLFVLSCFLGYIYEKRRSLWASVALHGFFNLISIITIFLVEG